MTVDKESFMLWDVKPLWTISESSKYTPTLGSGTSIEVYGVDRASHNNSRPLTRTSNLEKYNVGFVEEVEDLRVSIFVKEGGKGYEYLRRIAAGRLFFKLSCSVVPVEDNGMLNHSEQTAPWMQGFEEYDGCMISNGSVDYAVAQFPVRQFEAMALEHIIQDASIVFPGETTATEFSETVEGDGSYKRTL